MEGDDIEPEAIAAHQGIENAVQRRLSVVEAAELLQVSERQLKRLKGAYDPEDAGWVHHGNEGRVPANAISEPVRQRVIELAWQIRGLP